MSEEDLNSNPPAGEFILFQSADGSTRVQCRFESETLWLSQAAIGSLYGKAKATISEHISNILAEGECDEDSVVRFYRTTAADFGGGISGAVTAGGAIQAVVHPDLARVSGKGVCDG